MSPPETYHHNPHNDAHDGERELPLSLEDYAITRNGFLPEEAPLTRLPSIYYSPWESVMDTLSVSLTNRTLRSQVDQLPVLSTKLLAAEPEWRRAYLVLIFLAHAYIWGGDTASEILPPQLTLPLLTVSSHLHLPPVATYAGLNLWNFRTTSPSHDFTDLDHLHALHTFTGTEDESWFYMVSAAMEARGGEIISGMLRGREEEDMHDLQTTTQALREFVACIAALGGLLERMYERCRPGVYYHLIRPFLAGSSGMEGAGLPKGVFYDEGASGERCQGRKGQWRKYRGGSNGQSSLVQFLDAALGVEHGVVGAGNSNSKAGEKTDSNPKETSYHEEIRAYMPEPHRRFLRDVSARYPGGMRTLVGEILATSMPLETEKRALGEAFQTATQSLAGFRDKHMQIVARYIIIPSRHPAPLKEEGEKVMNNLATASSRLGGKVKGNGDGDKGEKGGQCEGTGELTGTGGTALVPFLKQSRDETVRAGVLFS
ncbi:Indoleamine 2,3-dioxygenase [Dichotomopilus funicola]|uniref:Indoleamine 2,3-dioxygenase n=1 Tax=Dichotomopilus funicola TaxID=1934379 RepID=A0AAN6ZJA7_9PEZI|nr:Indoleamine 2,3-dioxygenase [Dichotomopilus funicola]